MAAKPDFDRRALLKGGLTATAVGAAGILAPGTAGAAPNPAQPPKIFPTADWGAREPSEPIVVQDHKPTYIVVHHTVEPGNSEDYSQRHAFQISRDIQNFHMDTRGWSDTGQQFTNSRGGFVTEGRHRSLEVLRGGTNHVQGTHVGNHNSEALGIENEGLYTDVDVPQALWDSLVNLVTYIASQYGLTPNAIKGHRDFNSTECPGTVLYNRLPELRRAVGDALGVRYQESAEWPLLKPGSSGDKVLAAQRLLRNQGARGVPVDGVFGPSTRDAVDGVARAHGVRAHSCRASTSTDESGFLGADIWPLITPAVRPDAEGEAAKAARLLTQSARAATNTPLTSQAWKELLAR